MGSNSIGCFHVSSITWVLLTFSYLTVTLLSKRPGKDHKSLGFGDDLIKALKLIKKDITTYSLADTKGNIPSIAGPLIQEEGHVEITSYLQALNAYR